MRPRGACAGVFALVALVALAGCGGSGGSEHATTRSAPAAGARRTAPAPAQLPAEPAAVRADGPWPGYERDGRHSSSIGVVGPQRGRIRWTRRLEGPVVPAPVVGRGGVVYAASNGGVLHAIDLRSGRDRWRFDAGASYGSDLSTGPAVLPDGTVLWGGPNDSLYALTPTGRLRWRVQFSSFVLSPLLAPDGTVYVAEMAGTLHALALRGTRAPRERWALQLGGPTYGSPARGRDGTVYTTSDADLVAVTDAGEQGRLRWRFATGKLIEVSPAVAPTGPS